MTNAEAIRNCTDEGLAKLLTAIVLGATRRTVKSVTQRIFTDFRLAKEISLASAAVDAICGVDSDVAKGVTEAHLNWLKSDMNA